ncbi:hypothetical protein H6775_02315 [Candidatus Nomurabacteria bacterium]|nr:hypothetical protein [Candidatus Nomurabacteria bacterium]
MQELENIIKSYEQANNSHDWTNVEPFIHKDAIFWFTDGSYKGIHEIEQAVVNTFEK